jgi:hypothetical protein
MSFSTPFLLLVANQVLLLRVLNATLATKSFLGLSRVVVLDVLF